MTRVEAIDAYYEHVHGCTQCNLDKDCMACAAGYAADPPDQHSCNCPRGNGEGARLRALSRGDIRCAEIIRSRSK